MSILRDSFIVCRTDDLPGRRGGAILLESNAGLSTRHSVPPKEGTGLMGGVYWFPPRLRRQVYSLHGLRVTLHPNGTLDIEGTFDADLMRLTPEVERWVEGLRDLDARLEERVYTDPPEDVEEGIDRIERELAALRRRVCEENATSGCESTNLEV